MELDIDLCDDGRTPLRAATCLHALDSTKGSQHCHRVRVKSVPSYCLPLRDDTLEGHAYGGTGEPPGEKGKGGSIHLSGIPRRVAL